jgi:hypothetical protein
VADRAGSWSGHLSHSPPLPALPTDHLPNGTSLPPHFTPNNSEAQPTAWLAVAAVMAPLADMTGGERLLVGELDGYAGYRRSVFGEFR